MNYPTDDELMKMNFNELKTKYEAERDSYSDMYAEVKKYLTDIFNKYINDLGMSEYATLTHVSDENATITVCRTKSNRGHDIDLSFYRYDNVPHRLKMNYWSFGSFMYKETDKVKYMVALGNIADSLESIEKDICSYDWEPLYDAYSKMRSAESLLDRYNTVLHNRAEDMKKKELLAKMKKGSRIIIGVSNRYVGDKFVDCDYIKTVGSITGKNIMFDEDCGRRTKLDYALGQLILGNWKIKEKDTDTLVGSTSSSYYC